MKKENPSDAVRISVRNLVEWVLRSGDIDTRRTGPAIEDAMVIGAEAHRRIQAASGAAYSAEVALSLSVPLTEEPFTAADEEKEPENPVASLLIEGRADGLIEQDGTVSAVDEIKGIYRDIFALTEPEPVHLAQAEVYAYMVTRRDGLRKISVQMTYVQLEETKDKKKVEVHEDIVRRFTFDYTAAEIAEKFACYVEAYRKWVLFSVKHEKERAACVPGLTFPFEYRPGQKKIIGAVYKTVGKSGNLFVQAPTGTGKTLAMLYPSVQAVGRGLSDRIFYLTAKTVTANVAEEGMRVLRKNGPAFSYTKITAKEKMCVLSETLCDPVHCNRAKGHFSRVNDALYDLITHENEISSETVLFYAEKYEVCPYELSLDASLFTDVIICDYNYAFSPHVYLRRYFADGMQHGYIFLIDEAHNLAERARELFSATVVKEELLEAKKLFPGEKTVLKHIDKANKTMLELKRECEQVTVFDETHFPTLLYHELSLLSEALRSYLDRNPNSEHNKEKTDFFFKVRDFIDTYDLEDSGYVNYASYTEDGQFFVKLFCIQPAGRLSERLSKVRSTVFFSATFLPITYYKEILTGDKEEQAIYVSSPFDAEKRRLFIGADVSSKYTRRGKDEYRKIASYLMKTVLAMKGNYLAFFPSHKFLSDVEAELSDLISSDYPDGSCPFDVIAQKRVMTEEDKTAFLAAFSPERERALLGLSVLGGLFSEGIDLVGEKLIGVLVIGTGFPQISVERELIKAYYENNGENGFDYAYRFPGFNKVLQGAGRLIRTAEDYGVILLLDSRFRQYDMRALFPPDWADARSITLENASEELKKFWRYL